MKAQDNERYSIIRLFETFIHSLSCVSSKDAYLLTQQSARIPFSFRLASTLQKELMPQLPDTYFIDMGLKATDNSKALVPDIIIHDRKEDNRDTLMTIVCRNGYLSESELIALHTLRNSSKPDLTLAVAILPLQKYFLIYRSDEMFVDYYHFYIEHQHCTFLKRREIGDLEIDEKQLTLSIPSKKKAAPRQ